MHRGVRRKATAGLGSRVRKLAKAVERALSKSSPRARQYHHRNVVEALEERRLLATGVIINEFVASNTNGYQDPAFPGQNPDWIELYNPTSAPVNLQGWQLKDSGSVWTFPAGASIAANGYLVVAADSKNLVDPTKVMHTNFNLNNSGEYLGLLQPDGTVANEFAPAFPAQVSNVSYGITSQQLTTSFVGPTSPLKALIPTSEVPGWQSETFDDTSWLSGSGGVGFDADPVQPPAQNGWNVRMARLNTGDFTDISYPVSVLNNTLPPGFTLASDNSVTGVNYIDYMDGGHFSLNQSLPNGATTATTADSPLRNQYAIRATSWVTIPAGTYTIGVNSDDGFQLTIPGVTFSNRIGEDYTGLSSAPNQLTYGAGRGSADTLGTFTIGTAITTQITVDMYERTGGDNFEVFVSNGAKTSFDPATFGLLGNNTSGWTVKTSNADPTYQGQFGLDLLNSMRNVNSTAYVRIPFNVRTEDLDAFQSLLLHMKYDDGFVAWINGQQVAAQNNPASLTFQSAATTSHPDAASILFQDFTIPNAQTYLHAGLNVLTIQAMNVSAGDSDFLTVATLEGVTDVQDVTRYFSPPTPGKANTGGYTDRVKDTKFDHDRGFYDAPFQLTLTSATPGVTIRYTLDGSTPSDIKGTVYTGPITISKTTTLRAIALKPGYLPTNVDTQTYVFLDDVITQSASNSNTGTPPPGWPSNWSPNTTDYGMDPDVVNNPLYSGTIKNDLETIPTISIVTDLSNLFGSSGIYSNPGNDGIAWERRASMELINPDGSQGFQTDIGIRIRGGYSRSTGNPKHGLRVLLRSEYGSNVLDYPLFKSQNGVDQPASFDLRTFENYSWSFDPGGGGRFIGLRDQFSRDTQLDMGWNAERGDMYNLYIDGQYWGIYNTDERPEADYAASYYGGTPDDYDVIKVEAGPYTINATDGNTTGWNAFWSLANQLRTVADQGGDTTALYQRMMGNNPDGTRNPAYPVYLDGPNLIDYMLDIFYGGNLDAPISNFLSNQSPNNFYAVWNHTTKDMGFQYFAHDSEHTLLDSSANRQGPFPAGSDFTKSNPQWIFQQLLYNPDFRILVADRIHKHFFNGGALTTASALARFNKRRDEINRAIVGESARWGDSKNAAAYTYSLWQSNINTVVNQFINVRTNIELTQFRQTQMGDGVNGNSFTLYPSLNAPEFQEGFGGTFDAGKVFHLTNPSGLGTVYYTLDGSDPRLPGGALSPTALTYSAATGIPLNVTTRIRARIRNGQTWSAITDAVFALTTPPPLRITEIMYHPQDPPPGSAYTSSDLEYIEVQNISGQSINLKNFALTDGVQFTFPDMNLAAGARAVVVSNLSAFQSRYAALIAAGGVTIAGAYSGNLDNDGEHIRLTGALGETIQSFDYKDAWYAQTDGEGFSLEVRDPSQATSLWDSKFGWRASNSVDGDPGSFTAVMAPGSVVINELSAKVATPNTTWLELKNTTNAAIDISKWFLSNDPLNLKKYQFPAGTVIAANGFLVLHEESSYGQTGNPAALVPFTFDGDGNSTVILSQADAAGILLGYRESQDYGATDVGQTLGRVVQSDGGTDFVIQTSATPGAENAGPVIGPLVISEVMYGPLGPAVGGTSFPNPNMEFVEIRNITNQPVNLFDAANPANTWRMTDGIQFTFPQNVTIPAYGFIVLSDLKPTDVTRFVTIAPGAVILGPYKGFLNNAGEKITLQRPGIPVTPAGGGTPVVPYITVDKLSYDNKGSWAGTATANEKGPSLIRKDLMAYGNDPINWQASPQNGGSPGKDNLNRNPAVSLTAGPAAVEGGAWTGTGTLTDPDFGQVLTAQANWGDGSAITNLTVNPDNTVNLSHVYGDNGTYPVTVTVFDGQGGSGFMTLNVPIGNVAPTATFAVFGGSNIPEGGSRVVRFTNQADASATDVNAGFHYSYDFDNDGTFDLVDSSSSSPAIPVSILADGPHTQIIRARITDKDGGFTEYTTNVNVTNVPPTVDFIADQNLPAAGALNVGGTFSDPGADTWTGTVDWDYHAGDADAVPLTVNADGTFTLNHTYTAAGTYVVMVTVTDKDGGVGTSAFNVVVGGDNVPPQVVAGNFLYQTAPRQVAITFSEDVGASLQAGDLTVSNLTTSTDLPANATTMTWNASTLTATWTFAAGALTNANYRATLHGSAVSDGAGNAMSQDYGLDFFWLGGDANHNRTVDFNDLVPMAQNYNSTGGGKTYADGDFNGDGNVDFNDMVILAQNYNVALAAPTPSQPVAAPVSIGSPVMPSIDAVLQSLKNPTTTPTSGPSPTPKPTPKPSPKPVKSAPPTPVARPAAPKPLPVSKAAKAVTAAPPVFSNTRIATTAKKRSDLLG